MTTAAELSGTQRTQLWMNAGGIWFAEVWLEDAYGRMIPFTSQRFVGETREECVARMQEAKMKQEGETPRDDRR